MELSTPSAVDLASLAVAVAALLIAGIAWRRSDRNTSAGTLIAIFEAFRQGWERYLTESDAAKRNAHFHDLMNLFEVGSAIHQDGSVHGASKELLEDYMCDTLSVIAKNKAARAEIAAMRGTPEVFKYLKRFLADMRLRGHPHFIEPLVGMNDSSAPDPSAREGSASAPSATPDAKQN